MDDVSAHAAVSGGVLHHALIDVDLGGVAGHADPQIRGDRRKGADIFGAEAQQVGEGLVHHVQQTEDDRELDEGGAAAAHGVVVFLGIKSLQLLVHFGLVIFVLGLDLLHLGLDHLHFDGGFLLLEAQREQQHLDHQREQHQRDAVIADQVIQAIHQPPEGVAAYCHNKIHVEGPPFPFSWGVSATLSWRWDDCRFSCSAPAKGLSVKVRGTGSYPGRQKG